MRNKIRVLAVLMLLITGYRYAQGQEGLVPPPRIFPPSPEAQSLFKFMEYPVDHSTGIPEIKIPIFTIEEGKLSLPIELSYHAGGIKVNEIASSIGLGWTLSAGGMVSRTVNDYPDESREGYLRTTHYTTAEIDAMPHSYDKLLLLQRMTETVYDNESDTYFYSVGGNINGKFVYSLDNKITHPSFSHNQVKRDLTNDNFEVVDDKGTRFLFKERETCSEYSMNVYTSSWFLSDMISYDNADTIHFEYSHEGIGYTDAYSTYTRYPNTVGPPVGLHTAKTYISYPNSTLLKKIRFKNGSLDFGYSGDRSDPRQYRLALITINNKDDAGREKPIRKIEMVQDYFVTGSGSTNPKLDRRLRLKEVKILDALGSFNNSYQLHYNTTPLPSYHDYNDISATPRKSLGVDYWGYYNGVSTNLHLIPSRESWGANRAPSEEYMKAGVLERIVYPTGGYTHFVFESNRAPRGSNETKVVGGLRIKKEISTEGNLGKKMVRDFEYGTGSLITIGIDDPGTYSYLQGFAVNIGLDGNICKVENREAQVSASSSVLPMSLHNGVPVAYSSVSVYSLGENEKYRTDYSYDFNLDREYPISFPRLGDTYYADRSWDRGNLIATVSYIYKNGSYLPVKTVRRGYETLKTGRLVTGLRLHTNWIYRYTSKCQSTNYPTGYRDFDIQIDLGVKKISSETTVEAINGQEITTETKYAYGTSHTYPISTTVTNSDLKTVVTKYKYVLDYPGQAPYNELNTKNFLSAVISQEDFVNNSSVPVSGIRTNYFKWNSNLIAPQTVEAKNSGPYRTVIRYLAYNSQGKPKSLSYNEGPATNYIYGYGGKFPVAEIKNATYAQVESALGGATAVDNFGKKLNPSSSTLLSFLSSLRSNAGLKQSLVTTYTYNPLIGVTSISEANGKQTLYEYDNVQRLINVKDNQAKTISNYAYNYTNSRPYEYLSIVTTGHFTRNNCPSGYRGSSVRYEVPFGKYSSIISQADANLNASNDVTNNGQAYANANGSCQLIPVFYNVAKSGTFRRNNCPNGSAGSEVVYTVPAGTYSSTISQQDADNKAQADVSGNGQAYANQHGTCPSQPIYYNVQKQQTFTKNNCPAGMIGSTYTYTVAAGTYSSTVSQADADSKAQQDISQNGQNTANTNGSCRVDWSDWTVDAGHIQIGSTMYVEVTVRRPSVDSQQGAYVECRITNSSGNSMEVQVFVPANQTSGSVRVPSSDLEPVITTKQIIAVDFI